MKKLLCCIMVVGLCSSLLYAGGNDNENAYALSLQKGKEEIKQRLESSYGQLIGEIFARKLVERDNEVDNYIKKLAKDYNVELSGRWPDAQKDEEAYKAILTSLRKNKVL